MLSLYQRVKLYYAFCKGNAMNSFDALDSNATFLYYHCQRNSYISWVNGIMSVGSKMHFLLSIVGSQVGIRKQMWYTRCFNHHRNDVT